LTNCASLCDSGACRSWQCGRLTLSIRVPRFEVVDQPRGNELPDVLLGLFGAAACTRGENHVAQALQWAGKGSRASGSFGKTSTAAPEIFPPFKGACKSVVSDHKPAAQVLEACACFGSRSSSSPKRFRLPGLPSTCRLTMSVCRNTSSNEHRLALPRATSATSLKMTRMPRAQVGKLRADAPIANDHEDEAAHFVSTGRGLVPLAAVHFGAGREDAARA